MHRSYQSVLPCNNKLLKKRIDERYYEEHRQKIAEAKSMVDTKPPSTYMHLHLKLKKLQLEEERLATIERDNRILLEKMSTIMRTRGRIDNKNDYEYKSLNREKRMRELLRVTQENQDILKRIMARQPEYNRDKWDRSWYENQQFMDNISCYPKEWWLMRGKSSVSKGSPRLQRERTEPPPSQRERSSTKKKSTKAKSAETPDSDRASKGKKESSHGSKADVKSDEVPMAEEKPDSEGDGVKD